MYWWSLFTPDIPFPAHATLIVTHLAATKIVAGLCGERHGEYRHNRHYSFPHTTIVLFCSCAHAGVAGYDSVHEALLNNWDDPVHFDCPNGGALYRLTSHHGQCMTCGCWVFRGGNKGPAVRSLFEVKKKK